MKIDININLFHHRVDPEWRKERDELNKKLASRDQQIAALVYAVSLHNDRLTKAEDTIIKTTDAAKKVKTIEEEIASIRTLGDDHK